MKKLTNLIILLFAVLSIVSCKKDDDQGTIVAGGASTTNSAYDFVEFKIDGTKYRYQLPSTIPAAAGYTQTPILNVLGMDWVGSSGQDLVQLQLGNAAPLMVKDYIFSSSSSIIDRRFMLLLDSQFQYLLNAQTTGHIQLTQFDGISGHKVKGTFSFTKADYKTASGTFISGNHVITDGQFQATIQ